MHSTAIARVCSTQTAAARHEKGSATTTRRWASGAAPRRVPPPSSPLAAGPPCSRPSTAPQRFAQGRQRGAASAQDAEGAPRTLAGRNIVIAADSSEDSRYALRWTVGEVWRPGDTLHVVHCIPYLAVNAGVYAVPDMADGRPGLVNVDQLLASDEQFMLAEAAAMQQACDDAFAGLGVAHVVDVVREDPLGTGGKGRVAEALCRKAGELQAAAVVIASQAKGGLGELFLGSVAAHCAAHCTRPVLVLHAPQRGGAASGGEPGLLDRLASAAASALGGQPEASAAATAVAAAEPPPGSGCSVGRNIVLAVDDSDASERACAWALQHFWRPGDCFHLLRIIPTLPYRAAYGGPVLDGIVFYADAPTEAFREAAQRCVRHRFEPRLQAAGAQYEVDIIVEDADESAGGVGEAICRKADALQAAAVVLGSHMSGGLLQFMLGSVAAYVAHHSRRPVAVLH